MQSFENNRQKYIEMLNCQVSGISKILDTDKDGELISFPVREDLGSIRKSAERLRKKLETNEFEIAIVGLEKAGKSTFANALMGNDILPTKDERCTYTSTSIRYGSYDEAAVEFFSKDEFNKDFRGKLQQLHIDSNMPFDECTVETFEKKLNENDGFSTENANLVSDIKGIIKNKVSINHLLGSEKRTFGSEDFETEVKGYIEDPGKAIAVKEIVIRSSKLEKMKNAVIYDVPGFDSPTQMHKDQTIAKMKQADAIILVVAADKPSFNDSLVKFFSNVSCDDDGVRISEKTFVFANRADCATTLTENKNKIISEVIDYRVMNPEHISARIIMGSAKAKLDSERGLTDTPALIGIREKEITDGIEDIRSTLERYNENERLEVLSGKVLKLADNIHKLMEDLREQNNSEFSGADGFELEKNRLKSKDFITELKVLLGGCRDVINEKCNRNKPITKKVRCNIISKISKENYGITDEEILSARYQLQEGDDIEHEVEGIIRGEKFRKIYNDFIDGVLNLAVDEHSESKMLIKKAFMDGLGISEKNEYYFELSESVNEFIQNHVKNSASEGYYNSLIRRYSRDLFVILIRNSYSCGDRYATFSKKKNNFYSLSLFGENYDVSVLPGRQSMHSQILFHIMPSDNENDILESALILVENIIHEVILVNDKMYKAIKEYVEKNGKDSVSKLRELLGEYSGFHENTEFDPAVYPQVTPLKDGIYKKIRDDLDSGDTCTISAEITECEYKRYFSSYGRSQDKLKEEFDEDLFILSDILNNQVMKAIDIETPFIDLVYQEISDLNSSIGTVEYNSFIDKHAEKLLAEKAEQALKDKAKREKQQQILSAVSTILESIPRN